MNAELGWWRSLSGDDIDVNTAGVPPYDVERVATWVASLMGLLPPASMVLDLGCGTGRLTRELAKWWHLDATVAGVDVNQESIHRAYQSAKAERVQNVEFLVTDGRSMPNMHRCFGAYSVAVFQHLPHDVCAGYVRQIADLLEPGGRFVVQYVDGDEDSFASHQADWPTVRSWIVDAGLRLWYGGGRPDEMGWSWASGVK